MKKFTLFILCLSTATFLNSQVLLQEGFTATFSPAANGWNVQNLSAAANPTINWFQGNINNFASYDGGINDFFATDFLVSNSFSSAVTLSNWLITPTLTIVDGSVIKFATRTYNNPTTHPDRLEVYLSTAGAGTNVGSSPTSLGTFSTLLVSVNPSLTSTGYPGAWAIYSATISGVPSALTGRIGFRYYVTNGGPSSPANNSDYIGLDAVKYTGPCSISLPSFTTCAGTSATLTALVGTAIYSYSWLPSGSNNSSITVTPTSTSVYTLNYSANTKPCPAEQTTVTIGTQLSLNIISSKNPICSGESATMTVLSSASNFTWTNLGSNNPTISVTPSTSVVYSVSGSTGASTNLCVGTNTFQLSVFPTATINTVVLPNPTVCVGKTYSISAQGALSFFWYNQNGPYSYFPMVYSTPTVTGTNDYTITANDIYGCFSTKTISINVNSSPSVSVSATRNVICSDETTTLSATGASTYKWSGSLTSTLSSNLFSFNIPGSYNFTVVGTNTLGCKNQQVIIIQINACTGIAENNYGSDVFFQNPFTDYLSISGITGTINLIDLNGTVLVSEPVTDKVTINTSRLPKGVYVLQIKNLEGKIIKVSKVVRE